MKQKITFALHCKNKGVITPHHGCLPTPTPLRVLVYALWCFCTPSCSSFTVKYYTDKDLSAC